MAVKLPIGYDDFRAVIDNKLNFVDKSLFIKEVIDNNDVLVTVITRPRRFGKTLNLSMLYHFLALEVNQQKTEKLFDGLKIATADNGSYMQYQGKFPVVFISFKEVNSKNYDLAYSGLHELIVNTFDEYNYLENSDKLSKRDKRLLHRILNNEANRTEIERSLQFLTSILFKHFGIKPWVLIDEYDTPIQSGYLYGYYDEIINLMRNMFGAALKTNPCLERAVVTGILRVAKESIFSELNNPKIYSLLHAKYDRYFGFTEEEVASLLKQTGLEEKAEDIKRWYNGYRFGNTTVYNPWSIANCIQENGELRPYWANTSKNELIKDLLIQSTESFKEQFNFLLQDKTIEKAIDENMVFEDLKTNNQAAWSLLLMSGYLSVIKSTLIEGIAKCELAIPNFEIRMLYRNIIETWLGNGQGIEWYQNFLTDLLNGDVEKFTLNLGQVLVQTISVYDTAHNPEAFYHGFMLGLTAGVNQKQYELKSNRESGLGRYDIAIIPKNISKPAIVLEIKSIVPPKITKRKSSEFLYSLLTKESQKALEQINRNQYTVDLVQRGVVNIVKIGIAFSGKKFKVASEGGNRKRETW